MTKCLRKSIDKFYSVAMTVWGHGETVHHVGVCGRGFLLPAGKGKEKGRVRIPPTHGLWSKSGCVSILSLWKPDKINDGLKFNFLIC